MIPSYEVMPEIWLPEGDDCGYPSRDVISEEGFGYFRETWWIGRVPIAEAIETISFERELVAALDAIAHDENDYEGLARAAEQFGSDGDDARDLRDTRLEELVRPSMDDESPLRGLEIGVAGLTYALSAVGFRTAASCRAHSEGSWTDCPIILFGAHKWRAVLLAEFAAETGCGIGQDRDMLTVYAPSISRLMELAHVLIANRAKFRSMPTARRHRRRTESRPHQPSLGL